MTPARMYIRLKSGVLYNVDKVVWRTLARTTGHVYRGKHKKRYRRLVRSRPNLVAAADTLRAQLLATVRKTPATLPALGEVTP